MKNKWIGPVTLSGSKVVLEPLALEHLEGIISAVRDGELWKLWFTSIPSPEKAEEYINTALEMRENSGAMPFVIRDKNSNTIIGSTRYFNVDEISHRLEIGHTWYSESYQRTAANTEAKYLLLTHAFEKLDAIAVELRTLAQSQVTGRHRQVGRQTGWSAKKSPKVRRWCLSGYGYIFHHQSGVARRKTIFNIQVE